MNSSKKGEEVPLLNIEGCPGVPLLNFEGESRVPDSRVPMCWVLGSWSHFYIMPGQPMPTGWRRGRKEHLFYRTSPIG